MRKVLLILSVFMLTLPLSAQKKNSPEYVAKRKATILALDSLIHLASMSDAKVFVASDMLEKLIADQRKEFKNDPVLLSAIARSIATKANQLDSACVLYGELKRLHPQYVQGYIDYARFLHNFALFDSEQKGGVGATNQMIIKAKLQIDSAKNAVPDSDLPYRRWIEWRAPYMIIPSVKEQVEHEIEAWNTAFPNDNVYVKAAKLLQSVKMDDIPDYVKKDGSLRNLFDGRSITDMAVGYYEKAGTDALELDEMAQLSLHYYDNARYNLSYFEKGADYAQRGLQRCQNDENVSLSQKCNFYRMLLWNGALAAEKSKKDQAHRVLEAAQWLMTNLHDSLQFRDYLYAALACQTNGQYNEAKKMYHESLKQKNVRSGNYRNDAERKVANIYFWDSIQVYNRIFMCDTIQKNYQDAARVLKGKIGIMASHNSSEFPYDEWKKLANVYQKIISDTIYFSNSERRAACESIDSVLAVLQKAVDDSLYKVEPEDYTTNTFTRYYFRGKYFDKLSPDRKHLTTREMAHEYLDRTEPHLNKSEKEKKNLIFVYRYLYSLYYKEKDDRFRIYAKKWLDNDNTLDENLRKKLSKQVRNGFSGSR